MRWKKTRSRCLGVVLMQELELVVELVMVRMSMI